MLELHASKGCPCSSEGEGVLVTAPPYPTFKGRGYDGLLE
jgi:hypothetical protein